MGIDTNAAAEKFQPALPLWGVTSSKDQVRNIYEFQPALPLWGVTHVDHYALGSYNDFNPHSPCGE